MLPRPRSELYAHQSAWLDSHAFWSAMIGPYGCGKTGAAILFAWERSRINWGRRGLWVEPTYGMIQDIVLPELEEFLDAMEMSEAVSTRGQLRADEYRLVRSQRPQLELPWGVWMFRSGEIPRRLKGPTVSWALLDEADQMDVLVEQIVLSRVRDPQAAYQCFGHVGTPEVYGSWLHERVEGEGRQPDDCVVRARQEDVKGLMSGYYERMRDSYDPQAYEQFGRGQWVLNTDGLVFVPPFSDENIRPCKFHEELPVLVGMDFNVDPFCFYAAHAVVNGKGDTEVEVFREYELHGSNSEAAAQRLIQDFGESLVEIWCDEAGNQRRTSGLSGTDIAILRNAGFDVYWRHIKRVNNKFNSLRAGFQSASGKRRLFIDPSCKGLLREIRTLTYEESAKAGANNHRTDALAYLMFGKFDPARREV